MADSGLGFWSNLVSIGTDMTGGIMSGALTMMQNSKQRNWSSEEAAKQRAFAHQERVGAQDWAREMWNLNNMYNTPTRQMQRMMAAGINPNSAAGLVAAGDSSAPPASIAPAAGASAAMPAQFNEAEAIPSMLNATANYRAQLAQADLAKAMTEKTQEETKGIVIDNNYKPFEKDMDLAIAREKIKVMISEGQLNDIQGQNLINTFEVLKGKSIAEINELNSLAAYYNEQLLQSRQQIELLREQIKTEQQKRDTLAADEYEAYMNGQAHTSIKLLNGKQGDLAEANKELSELEAADKRKQNEYREELRKKGINPDHPQMKDNVFVAALKSNGTVEDIKTAFNFAKAGWSIISNYVDQERLKLNQNGSQNIWQKRYGKRK